VKEGGGGVFFLDWGILGEEYEQGIWTSKVGWTVGNWPKFVKGSDSDGPLIPWGLQVVVGVRDLGGNGGGEVSIRDGEPLIKSPVPSTSSGGKATTRFASPWVQMATSGIWNTISRIRTSGGVCTGNGSWDEGCVVWDYSGWELRRDGCKFTRGRVTKECYDQRAGRQGNVEDLIGKRVYPTKRKGIDRGNHSGVREMTTYEDPRRFTGKTGSHWSRQRGGGCEKKAYMVETLGFLLDGFPWKRPLLSEKRTGTKEGVWEQYRVLKVSHSVSLGCSSSK